MSPEKKLLFHQLFGDKLPNLKDLPEESLRRRIGQINEAFFTEGVNVLKNAGSFPNKHVNELMSLFWNLVGSKLIPLAMTKGARSLAFYVERKGIDSVEMIMVPQDFYLKVLKAPYMQLGALTFIASQARDFYNQKLSDPNAVRQRSHAYEAEYLNTLKQLDGGFSLNNYQIEVLNRYPKGLMSLDPSLRYTSTPFIKPLKS